MIYAKHAGILNSKRIKVVLIIIFSFALFFSNTKFTSAIEYGGVGGRPAYPRPDNPRTESIFVHTISPEESINEGIKVINNTSEKKTLLVYSVDSVVSSGGAFACAQLAEDKKEVGKWISVSKSEVTLDSLAVEIVPFVITAPKEAGVGEHNGCLVVQEKKDVVDPSGKNGILLSFRTGLRVALTIPGEIVRKVEVSGFTKTSKENGDIILHPKVKNLGNVSVDTDVKVTTNYFFGTTLINQGGQYPILRDQESDWNFELIKPFWGGFYKSTFTAEYDSNTEATVGIQSGKEKTKISGPSIWFFSTPAPAAMGIEFFVIILTCALLFFILKAVKNKKSIKDNWIDYSVQNGEDINSIANKNKISWKILARANKLKPPYALKEGDKIKTPSKKQEIK